MRFVCFNNENDETSSKDPLHVIVCSNMMQFKIGAKRDHRLVKVIRESFPFCQFQDIDWLGNEESSQICQFSVRNIPSKDSAINGKLLACFQDNKSLFTFVIVREWPFLFYFYNIEHFTFLIVRDQLFSNWFVFFLTYLVVRLCKTK